MPMLVVPVTCQVVMSTVSRTELRSQAMKASRAGLSRARLWSSSHPVRSTSGGHRDKGEDHHKTPHQSSPSTGTRSGAAALPSLQPASDPAGVTAEKDGQAFDQLSRASEACY